MRRNNQLTHIEMHRLIRLMERDKDSIESEGPTRLALARRYMTELGFRVTEVNIEYAASKDAANVTLRTHSSRPSNPGGALYAKIKALESEVAILREEIKDLRIRLGDVPIGREENHGTP